MGLELLLLLGLGGQAHAWSLNGSTWDWQGRAIEDPIHVAPGSFRADEVSEADLQAAIDEAMLTWSEAGYDLALTRGEDIDDPVQRAEGVLELFHGSEADSDITLAYTAVWGYEDGRAFDCDVLFLDEDEEGDILWSADPAGAPEGSWDVQAVALHELGHCLGLSHSEDPGAVMYARYSGQRALGADDLEGLAALYEPDCPDADGDGVGLCAGDCADDNALVSPETAELCNGLDDNCNGAVDEEEGLVLSFGSDGNDADWSGLSVGNGFRVGAATTLRSLRQRWEGPEGARLVWAVSRLDGSEGQAVFEARGEAVAGEWQQSPDLHVVLEAGETYAVQLGSISDGVTMFYEKRPSLEAMGPLTPLGSLYGRAIGDQITEPDSRYLADQELTPTAAETGAPCGSDTGEPGETGAEETGSPDTEPADTATGDSGLAGAGDTGAPKPGEGCACAGAPPARGLGSALALLLVLGPWSGLRASRRRPRHPPRAPHTPVGTGQVQDHTAG